MINDTINQTVARRRGLSLHLRTKFSPTSFDSNDRFPSRHCQISFPRLISFQRSFLPIIHPRINSVRRRSGGRSGDLIEVYKDRGHDPFDETIYIYIYTREGIIVKFMDTNPISTWNTARTAKRIYKLVRFGSDHPLP